MKKYNKLVVFVVTLASLALGLFVLYTPIPRAAEAGFSAIKAASYIEAISREPHSVDDPAAHESVRLYLKNMLETFVGAANVAEMDYTAEELGRKAPYGIRNLLGTIPGDSGTGILLVAHYDSRGFIGRNGELGRSYGAADDGYGLATILEIARLYGRRHLRNSIYLLFTDAEEAGMHGAVAAARETELMSKVGFVVNLEARGVDGPVYMFETSPKNEKVIDFYRRADLPVSYSLATAVYRVMPNATDFTHFLAAGKQGINFAVLGGLSHYHSPLDNYTAIDLSSIQHYGAQVVPLVEAFATDSAYSDPEYFSGDEDSVFFTILPNVFIAYSESAARALHLLMLALFAAFVAYLSIRKELKPLAIVKYLGWILVSIAAFAVLGAFLSKLVAFLGKTTWSLTYVRTSGAGLPVVLAILATAGTLGWLAKKKVAAADRRALMLAGVFLNLVLATATGIILSGGSFLFFVPALIGFVSLLAAEFAKNRIVSHVFYSQNILWNMLLMIPILYSLFLALTVGGLAALLVVLILDLSIVVPSMLMQAEL